MTHKQTSALQELFETEEVWKPVIGYEGFYEVSNLGRVQSLERYVPSRWGTVRIAAKILKPVNNHKGYYQYSLSKDNSVKQPMAHRLVAEAFLGVSSLQVNHINGVKTDNRPENLEYVTARDNTVHRLGRKSGYTGVYQSSGSKKWYSTISVNGKIINLGYYNTEIEAAQAYKNKLIQIGEDSKYARLTNSMEANHAR
jgi:hypothetical protein